MPGWPRRKFTGGTTAIIAGIAGTIPAATTIIITVTGTGGDRASLALKSGRPVLIAGLPLIQARHETGKIAARYRVIWISNRSPS
jgi:hypothetical protein